MILPVEPIPRPLMLPNAVSLPYRVLSRCWRFCASRVPSTVAHRCIEHLCRFSHPLPQRYAAPLPIILPTPPVAGSNHQTKLNSHHRTTTTAMIIPANLKIATLFPDWAMRPSRPALPFSDVVIDEKTSDYIWPFQSA